MASLADPDRQRLGVEPGAAAGGAGLGELILPEEDPDVLLVALLLQPLEEGKDADVAALPSVEQLAPVRRLEPGPGLVGVGAELRARNRAASGAGPRSAAWSRDRSRPRRGSASGSGTISDSSYSSTAPKPLQPAQAPRGLLNEKRAGVTDAAGVSQALQAGNSVKRSRPLSCSATATPSPSWNAVAIASRQRGPADSALAVSRSTTTSTRSAAVRSSPAGSSSRW